MQSIFLFLCLAVLLAGRGVYASDLDDGISKHTDDSIEHDDEIGQGDKNITYIKQRARSTADVAAHGATEGLQQGAGNGNGNMDSVVVGPGGNIRGDVYIIDEGRGPKTQVIGR